MKFVLFLALAMSSLSAWSKPLTTDEKLADYHQLISLIRSSYGPLEYKQTKMKMDIDGMIADYEERVKLAASNAEFYYLIVQFVAGFHDGHFSARIPTEHSSNLPFRTDFIQDKVLITFVDRDSVDEKTFPFAVGDEIIAIDGRPVADVLDDLQKYISTGFKGGDRRIAAMTIPLRRGARVPVQLGDVELSIRRGTSSLVENVKLKWTEKESPLDEMLPVKTENRWIRSLGGMARIDFDHVSVKEVWDDHFGADRDYLCNAGTRITKPEGAVEIMNEPFVAYYFPTAKGNVGYLRIPDYSPVDAQGNEDYARRFRQYEYAVSELEKNTVGLVIDQDHNCGGSVSYLHQVLSLFIDKPVPPMQFELMANKNSYLQFKQWAKEETEHTLSKNMVEKVLKLIEQHWLAGDKMTPKTSIDGLEFIDPNPVRYTKPIVMTIDELSGSGGDAFPSLMQGYGRARLLGKRTMGAGGHVQEAPDLFFSQIQLRVTKSLFYRPDGVPVENNGAVPDIDYALTRDDIVYGYKGYLKFATDKLLNQ